MENPDSPLKKYSRVPKLYIDLPSQGNFYPPGSLGKSQELEVFSMTASDEIRLKTPDALYTGTAVADIIKRCVPDIKNPWAMPTIDFDFVLAAVRLATYGSTIELNVACSKCKEESAYEFEIQRILDHFSNQTFVEKVMIQGFEFYLRPLDYKELTVIRKETFSVQRNLAQLVPKIEDLNEKQEKVNEYYDQINKMQTDVMYSIVHKIVTPDGDEETNHKQIVDFLSNAEPEFYHGLKNAYGEMNKIWAVPSSQVTCPSCSNVDNITPSMDYSTFFGKG